MVSVDDVVVDAHHDHVFGLHIALLDAAWVLVP
jgi:hypothetical protein